MNTSANTLFDDVAVIDVDTHITEPPDLWSSRVPAKWADQIPKMENIKGRDYWVINGKRALAPGSVSMAGYDGHPPRQYPPTFADIPPAAYDAKARLTHMDSEGIYAQVLYPNVGGFGSQNFLRMDNAQLKLACVMAYNDFLAEWASADNRRLLPVCALPFWDVDQSVKEIQRCAEMGHKSVLFPSQPQDFQQPDLYDMYWDPIWECAQSLGLPISFHIGGQAALGIKEGEFTPIGGKLGTQEKFARYSSLAFVGNSLGISEIICGGVCQRFPNLNFVSVESGVGWIPAYIEALDWQWQNAGLHLDSKYDLLPSEYFRRQIYACFWFEKAMLGPAIEMYPDNIMYETDFPHPTSMSPGPATIATHPREYAAQALGQLPQEVARKVLSENAAKVYGVALPE